MDHAHSSTISYLLVFPNSDYFYIVHEKRAVLIGYILGANYCACRFIYGGSFTWAGVGGSVEEDIKL